MTIKHAVVSRQASKDPYPYVYVSDDGSWRELVAEERRYLEENFHPADGARPYVKFRYRSLTPDYRLRGFLHRRRLPRGLPPGQVPVSPLKPWWKFW